MMGLFLLLVFVVISATEKGYGHFWNRSLTFSFHFIQPAVYAGSRVQLQEVIDNAKSLPVPVLEAGFRIEKGVSFEEGDNTQTSDYVYKRDVFSLLGKERIIRTHTVECLKRGYYSFSQLSLVTYSNLLHWKYSTQAETDEHLYVYARRTDISGILPAIDSILGERETGKRLYEDPFTFAGIRPYTPQDPQKTVNWKATAKTGNLMVNTYASVQSEEVMVYLDVSDPLIVKREELTEESISLAATICSWLLNHNLAVGLCVNTNSFWRLSPRRGPEQLRRIEQFLVRDFSKEALTDFGEMAVLTGRQRERVKGSLSDPLPVFISKNAEEAVRRKLLSSLKKGEQGVWVIPVKQGHLPDVSGTAQLRVCFKSIR